MASQFPLMFVSMDAAIAAYDHINGRWKDIQRFYFLAKRPDHAACEVWCTAQLNSIVDMEGHLGDRPDSTTCLVELISFQNDSRYGNKPMWFEERYATMPFSHRGGSQLI